MNKQTVIDALRDILNDRKALERKLRTLERDQRLDATILGVALTRIENFEDDVKNAIDEIETREG